MAYSKCKLTHAIIAAQTSENTPKQENTASHSSSKKAKATSEPNKLTLTIPSSYSKGGVCSYEEKIG